jgi:catechol 2,3-dioxygenase-like lactoylglutathione lyase family enzyme
MKLHPITHSMTVATACALSLASAIVAVSPAHPAAQGAANMDSARKFITQNSMNVFRRFAPEHRDKMVEYYGTVLGLRSLSPVSLGGGNQMILFGIGTGQVKLASGLVARREFRPVGHKDATGLRIITLFFPDEAALVARFRDAGYPVPQFKAGADGTRVALVADPGGFTTELVIRPNAPAGTYDTLQVGINASNVEKSREFYRDFVGLDELPPVKDPILGVTKYPYRHGETTINVWSIGTGLPKDTGSAGIQYVVNDAEAVDVRGKARNVTVETPLGLTMGTLRTVWLNDPDGVTNYFAQILGRGGRGANTTQ